jgi:hypothetical protein
MGSAEDTKRQSDFRREREDVAVFSDFLLQNMLLYGKMKIPKT